MASWRTTFTLDAELAERARQLGVNVSAAARQGVADAVRAALEQADREAVINCDGLHTIAQGSLTGPLGRVGDDVMRRVCSAVSYALGC